MGNCKECERLEKVCRDTHNDLVRAMEENNKLREEILELKKLTKNLNLEDIRFKYQEEINNLKVELEEAKAKITLQTKTREISDKQVQEIKELRASGLSYRAIEEEINNKINNLEKINVCLDLNSKLDDKINTYTIPINDGEIILEYKLTQNESPLREYVSYGSYTLELTAKITHLTYPDTILCLNTDFTVSSDGLRATSTSTAGTFAVFPNKVSASSKITDSRAEKISYNINGQGDYTYTVEALGNQFMQWDRSIVSTITWEGVSGNKLNISYNGRIK
jgi:predicted transport protein